MQVEAFASGYGAITGRFDTELTARSLLVSYRCRRRLD